MVSYEQKYVYTKTSKKTFPVEFWIEFQETKMAEIKESEGSKARASEVFAKLQRIPKYWDHKRTQNRVCIREGILFEEDERKLKPRYCFLFNDSFIVTKPVVKYHIFMYILLYYIN